MKKKALGILLCLIVAVLVTGCNYNKKEEKTVGFYIDNLDKDNDGLPDNEEFKYEDGKIVRGTEVIYDQNNTGENYYDDPYQDVKIPKKEKIDELDLREYLKIPCYELYKDSHDKITGDTLHQLILSTAIQYFPRTTKDTIAKLAKIYLDIDNYELPVGTYYTNRFGIINVIKIGDVYVFVEGPNSIIGGELQDPWYSHAKSYELNGNELIIVSDLADYSDEFGEEDPELIKLYGTQTMYLEFTKNGLKIKKVEYVSNE